MNFRGPAEEQEAMVDSPSSGEHAAQPLKKCDGFTLELTAQDMNNTEKKLREVIRCTRKKVGEGEVWGDCGRPWLGTDSYTISEEQCEKSWKDDVDTGMVLISSMWRAMDKLARQMVPSMKIKSIQCRVKFGKDMPENDFVISFSSAAKGPPSATKGFNPKLSLRTFKLSVLRHEKPPGIFSQSPLQDITAAQVYKLLSNARGGWLSRGVPQGGDEAAQTLAEDAFGAKNDEGVEGTILISDEDGMRLSAYVNLKLYASYDHTDRYRLKRDALLGAGGVGLSALGLKKAHEYYTSK